MHLTARWWLDDELAEHEISGEIECGDDLDEPPETDLDLDAYAAEIAELDAREQAAFERWLGRICVEG